MKHEYRLQLIDRITDPRQFGKVAVVMGGNAAEREISLISGNAVLAALLRKEVDAVAVDSREDLVSAITQGGFDRVFNIVHGRGGEDGVLQGLLETLQLPYTGSGILPSALSMDKLRTKLCWRGASLPTPKWYVLREESDLALCADKLGFPVIVKPSQEGSSIGMSRVTDLEELKAAWERASLYNCEVFAEQWIQGIEYTAALLHGEVLPLIRLETPNVFYDFDAKYQASTTRYHCPCGLSPTSEAELQTLVTEACNLVGIQGWGRVDLFVDTSDQAWLIEINTVPGMTDHSLVPMAAAAYGIEFDELVWRVLETSVVAK